MQIKHNFRKSYQHIVSYSSEYFCICRWFQSLAPIIFTTVTYLTRSVLRNLILILWHPSGWQFTILWLFRILTLYGAALSSIVFKGSPFELTIYYIQDILTKSFFFLNCQTIFDYCNGKGLCRGGYSKMMRVTGRRSYQKLY